ncbi:MAG: TonB-dependent receptor plug domain-containing protein, partial [Gammaproteobacteria bacterium]|nr:TonB-dependent receptor plug domain-containing protein [Gammaproteobacteria bacterium]
MFSNQVLSVNNRNRLAIAISLALTGGVNVSFAQEPASESEPLDVMSVTATREERESKDVPVAISIIDAERIENSRMFNVTDALSGTPGVLINSKNGGYDARLIIRGAGLKANYGIREIMVLRDGVPVTDPDSFTRLDFIDTQDIERIEVTKGPGNIYALGSAGGTIQLISKSVFDTPGTTIKLGAGTEGTYNLHARSAFSVGKDEDQALALTYSHRSNENDWRYWNEFSSNQVSIKHGILIGSDSTLETELSYTKSNLNLPGSINEAQFETFKDTGEVTDNNSAFKHSARNSE